MVTYKQRRLQLGVAFFGFLLVGIIVGAWGVLLPSLSTYYSIDKSVIGLLFFASAGGYLLSAVSSGYLVHKYGLRWFLVLGSVAFLISGLILTLKPPFIIIVVTRLFMGMGIAVVESGINLYATRLPDSTSWLNYLHAFFGVGALIGPVMASGMLALNWEWNYVYLVCCIFAVPLLIGLLIAFKEQPDENVANESENRGVESGLGAVLRLPIMWLTIFFLLFYVGVESTVGNWSYSFLLEHRHTEELLAGWTVSGYWLGLTLGRFAMNAIMRRLHMSISSMMYVCIAGVGLGLLILWLFSGVVVDVFGFTLIGFCLGPIYPTTVALLPGLVPARVVTTAIGFLTGLSVLGIALFPWFAGVLAQYATIWSLLPYNAVLALVMLAFWIAIAPKIVLASISSSDKIAQAEKV